MIEACSTAWKKWPLWYVLVTTLLQCAIGQAGRLIAAAAVMYYVASEQLRLGIPLAAYGLIVSMVSVAIILRGRYKAVEMVAQILTSGLVVSGPASTRSSGSAPRGQYIWRGCCALWYSYVGGPS